jgi:hypothetical protein
MNLGLSNILKYEFSKFIPVERPLNLTNNIPDPNRLAGFVTGEGKFDVRLAHSNNKIGKRVQLRFRITQHERDVKLMEYIIKYLGSGKIYKYPKNPAVSFTIVKFSDIINIIIPFFETNPLFGVKQFDYFD